MIDALNQIVGFFTTLWDVVMGFINALGFALTALVEALAIVPQLTILVPSIIGSAIVIFVAVYVVKFVLGR